MSRLLVSVRSVHEAEGAVAGGASVLDVKEPRRGSLGRSDPGTWKGVRQAIPHAFPVSAALGELREWTRQEGPQIAAESWADLAFCKVGLARAGLSWRSDWSELRQRTAGERRPRWVAVCYADWLEAQAPSPADLLEETVSHPEIAGVLIDTWNKAHRFFPNRSWEDLARIVRASGRFLAVAGGLDLASIPRLANLAPDIVAVRGAACVGGNRGAAIDPARVETLARVVARLPSPQLDPFASCLDDQSSGRDQPQPLMSPSRSGPPGPGGAHRRN